METRKQVNHIPNPTGKGGFGDNPENRGNGSWRKELSFGYQYKRFMNMSVTEFEEWNKNTNKSERTIVEDLASRRVMEARDSLADIKEITDRTEGKAMQNVKLDGKLDTGNRYDNLSSEEIDRAKRALIKNAEKDNS